MRTPPTRPLLAAALVSLLACGQAADPTAADADDARADPALQARLDALPAPVAATYATHADDLPAGRHLAYDLALTFGGTERFRGAVTQSPSMDRIALRRESDGAELRYDGRQVGLVRADTSQAWPGARFAAFTWPYFFAAPFKLADPGTQWAAPRDYPWRDGRPATGARLTFAPGTGDAPDDYYVVFPDPEARLDGMAYVVTFGKPDADAAELEPHAIVYHDYRDVGGVPVAHRWTFHNWSEEGGLDSARIGEATLRRVRWVDAKEGAYATADAEVVER